MNTSACFLPLLASASILLTSLPAAENLLSNPSGQDGATSGWTIISSGGNGWAVDGSSADSDGASFITSYAWCTRSQTVDLIAAGHTAGFLDTSPPILARESFRGRSNNNEQDSYYLRVELRDENGTALETWEAGSQNSPLTADDNWREESHLFENYPQGVRQIYWEDGGIDEGFWAGHYGVTLDAAELSFFDPAPTGLHLTPATYPVSAPAGGVAGVLVTDDNPGATHTYALISETSNETLVPQGSEWAYLDDGSDQGTAWSESAFDDSLWATGFAELGYGENDETTVIAGLNSHLTTYYRHRFTIAPGGLAGIQALTLQLKRDDGAVVYLNGTEVARDNLTGVVTFDTAAANATDDGQLFHPFDIPAGFLVEGENVLAVEVHQTSLTSSDTSFDLSLSATKMSDNYDNDLFVINGDELRFAQAGPAVPVSAGGEWTVYVQSTDDAGSTFAQLFTVTGVPDPVAPPTAVSLSSSVVTEGNPVGTLIGDLSATDADSGDYLFFTLVSGAGDTHNAMFQITGNRLYTAAEFDASLLTSASVRVRATDRTGAFFEQSLTVTVLDLNDPSTGITFTGTEVAVGTPAGTLIGTLDTIDPDPIDTFAYEFVPTNSTEQVFSFGSDWRYLDDGSDLGSGWTGVYDDSAWATGAGSFGYGDAQWTIVSYGLDDTNKHVTTYFRRTFEIADPGAYDGFELQFLRDDGVAVYLNGVEVARDNLIAGADALTYANEAIGGTDETTPVVVAVPGNLFNAGANTLAAEIHQATAGSSDLTFDLALSGVLDDSGAAYFDIVNGNEIRTNAGFPGANVIPGTTLNLVIQSTDRGGETVVQTFAVSVISNDPNDIDGDSLPDDWERTHFTVITTQRGDDDSDGDGQTNLQELIFDTLPNNAASRLQLTVIPNGLSHTVQWPSSAARNYRLQASTNMETDSWSITAGGLRAGTGAMMSETVPNGTAPARQFRLLVEIP